MRHSILLTEADANMLLELLQELPIKYLGVVQAVQRALQVKFQEEEAPVCPATSHGA